MKKIPILLSALAVFTLAGCGGGEGGEHSVAPESHTATVKLATNGTPSERLAGVGVTVTLPDGITPPLDGDGKVAASVVKVTGVAAPGMVLPPVYTPASGTAKATIRLAMVSGIADGFGAGEFLTMTLALSPGVTPVVEDFPLTSFNPVDLKGGTVTGLTLEASVATQ